MLDHALLALSLAWALLSGMSYHASPSPRELPSAAAVTTTSDYLRSGYQFGGDDHYERPQ